MLSNTSPDSKVHWSNMGPTRVLSAPMLDPWTLLSGHHFAWVIPANSARLELYVRLLHILRELYYLRQHYVAIYIKLTVGINML